MPRRKSIKAQIAAPVSTKQRLRRTEEGLCHLPIEGALYAEPIRPNDQMPPQARGPGSHARSGSFCPSEARSPNSEASHGTFLRALQAVWLRPGAVARAVEDANPGLSDLCHPEHPGADQARRKTEEMGGGEGLGGEEGFHPDPIAPDGADPGPTPWAIPLSRLFFSRNLGLRDSREQTWTWPLKNRFGQQALLPDPKIYCI